MRHVRLEQQLEAAAVGIEADALGRPGAGAFPEHDLFVIQDAERGRGGYGRVSARDRKEHRQKQAAQAI